MFKKKIKMISPYGKRVVKIPKSNKPLSTRKLIKILKKAGISEEEFLKGFGK